MTNTTPQKPVLKTAETDETRRDWEVIQENTSDKTERLKVSTGTLYRVVTAQGQVALTHSPK